MPIVKEEATKIGKRVVAMKSVAASALAQKGKKSQSETVAKAFAVASKRTGIFTSKYAK